LALPISFSWTSGRATVAPWILNLNLKHQGRGGTMSQKGINVLALLKGEERYIFLYDDRSAEQILQTLGSYAADPELSFSWYDAAVLSQRVRQLRAESDDASPTTSIEETPRNRIGRSAA